MNNDHPPIRQSSKWLIWNNNFTLIVLITYSLLIFVPVTVRLTKLAFYIIFGGWGFGNDQLDPILKVKLPHVHQQKGMTEDFLQLPLLYITVQTVLLWTFAHPFWVSSMPLMPLMQRSRNLFKNSQPCSSPRDGLNYDFSIGKSSAPEERSSNFVMQMHFEWSFNISTIHFLTPSPHFGHNHPFVLY